jgi:periplasmic glucans biosynthesis protein
LVRRLQLFCWGLLGAAICVLPFAMAQTPPAQPPSNQAPLEQTQPAATSPGTGQAPPATTPPSPSEDQEAPPPSPPAPAQPKPTSQGQAPPENPRKPAARADSSKPESTQRAEGASARGEGARNEAAKAEGTKGEATQTDGSNAESVKGSAARTDAAKAEGSARAESARAESAKGEGGGAKSEGAKGEARSEGATRGEGAKGEAKSEGATRGEGAKGEAKGEGGARSEGAKGEAKAESKTAQSESGQGGPQPRRTRPAGGEGAPPGGQSEASAAASQQAAAAAAAAAKPAAPRPPVPPFSFALVEKIAQDRSSKPYRNRSTKLPDAIAKLTYEQYRDIRFQRTSSLWYDRALFEVQFFHRGFNFDRRVNVSEVSGGVARPVLYNPSMFDFGPRVPKLELSPDLGFAGFRIHYPLNTPAYKDELIVFLGASYFRVLGRNQTYGLSARGLAIDTGSTSGEEFPYFTDFWLVKPEPTARTMTVYAVLDSPGISGAYQFEIRPGTTTQVQVTAELYPRRQIGKLGIAPLTSMFLYGENSGVHRFDDFRPEVHDSDGLMTERGTGEWMWRPLVNPKELRVNRFMDEHPHSFALVQRDRDFNHFQDNEARYERRPSYRVEPLGDWGKGGVELVEIPSDEEIHDNIVAFWVPDAPVQPQKPMTFSYLLSAYAGSTQWPPGGKVIATHFSRIVNGTNVAPGMRRVIVDFAGGDLDSLAGAQPIQAQASASGGEIDDISVERLAANGVWRVSMRMKTSDKPVDLRCYLTLYGEALTETWTYLWAPGT